MKYFLGRDYCVEVIDGSKEMVKIASKNTGIEVKRTVNSKAW